jgi:hypothetical protein
MHTDKALCVSLAIPVANYTVCGNAGDSAHWVQPSELFDESCGYAVGGAGNISSDYELYSTEAGGNMMYCNIDGMVNSPFAAINSMSGLPELCDMCGQELPPASSEELRNQHIQVHNFLSNYVMNVLLKCYICILLIASTAL